MDHSGHDNFFEGLNEKEARNKILELVGRYCDLYHNQSAEYVPGERIGYAGRVYGREEMMNLADSSLEFWLTMGRYTAQFEEDLARFLGVRYVHTVNSGSSANLISFMALTSPLLGERAIRRGDEVITVSCGFPTTVSPILNFGAVPVFVDVTIPEYNIDVSELEGALSKRTKAVMLAHTLGNPFDLETVSKFCKKNNLWLIEDNCDALGSRFLLDGKWHFTGTIGDIGTSSFYPPHHITMGEGGATYTQDTLLHRIMLSLRDWGRDCVCHPGEDNRCGHRFDGSYGLLPRGYDHKYVYSNFGYNLSITDMQAAVGCAQLKRLDDFTEKRKYNWEILREELGELDERLILPRASANSDPSWFGFCMTLREGLDRARVLRFIEDHGVQTRLLFAGNLIKHPCFDAVRGDEKSCRVVGELKNTDIITERTFWIGVYPGMTLEKLYYMADVVKKAVNSL